MPGPVYSYQWWSGPQRRGIEWQQGRSLLLFAAAATFPIGAASTELPPQRAATPVAVGWQAPNNGALQLAAPPVTIASGSVTAIPTRPSVSVGWDAPPNLVIRPATPLAAGWTDIPARAAPFRPADNFSAALQFVTPTLRSAQAFDLTASRPGFTQADVYPTVIPPGPPPALLSASALDVPVRVVPFFAADVWNPLLPGYTPAPPEPTFFLHGNDDGEKKRKPYKNHRQEIRKAILAVLDGPEQVKEEAKQALQPFAKFAEVTPQTISIDRLARDVETVQRLLELARQAETERLEQDDEEALLLLL